MSFDRPGRRAGTPADAPAPDNQGKDSREVLGQEIRKNYPGWNVYVTRNPDGTPAALMASRRRRLTNAEQAAGLAATLPMGFFGDLVEQLAAQARLERAMGGDR
jgi:hypothetical protein